MINYEKEESQHNEWRTGFDKGLASAGKRAYVFFAVGICCGAGLMSLINV